jgi:ABC-type sugar transport system ATPase subunit
MSETVPPALSVQSLSKRYGAHWALTDFSAEFRPGTVTALLGENGSGKSTLIKALAGVHQAEPGAVIEVGGRRLPSPVTPAMMHDAGLRFVHQDLGLITRMSVTDNLAFTLGFFTTPFGSLRPRAAERHARELFERLGMDINPRALVTDLSPAQRTMLAIARALDAAGASSAILVLDEPTAALPVAEADKVFAVVDGLRAAGGTIILVTHRTDEVVALADELLVLRGGRLVESRPAAGLDASQIVTLILGRELAAPLRRASAQTAAGEKVLELDDVSGGILDHVTLSVSAGEVLGIAGLTGCGRSELTRIITGAQRPLGGSLRLDGAPFRPGSPRAALAARVASVPQDRHGDGIVGDLPMRANISLSDLRSVSLGPFLSPRRDRATAVDLISRFDIQPPTPERPMKLFSGGNQQKGVLARAIRTKPRLLVLDEPTQGVDAGARQAIGLTVRGLLVGGGAVVLGSSDTAELAELSDRVIVLDRGRIVGELRGAEITAAAITALASGAPTPTQENR